MSSRFSWPRLAAVAAVTALVMAALLLLLVYALRPVPVAPPEAPAQGPPPEEPPARFRTAATESYLPVTALPPPKPSTEGDKPAAVAPLPPPPAQPRADTAEKVPTRYKAGDTFTQEVIVTRRSAYRILGADVGQNVQYVFVSRLVVDRVERDGGLVVKQKVREARFSDGDPALQALLNDALKKTQGNTFEITLNARGEVTRFKGANDPLNVFAGKDPLAGQTFLLWSFLDEDAWKELAQLTFFRPEKPLQSGVHWSRSLSHSWGSLGSWRGQTTYTPAGQQAGRERITYTHEMSYQAPRGRDGLPFLVKKADFQPLAAGGTILFDAAKEKVADAEETFRVRGRLRVAVADAEAVVDMDETQVFRLRINEGSPGN
jgi:hypothetical protein